MATSKTPGGHPGGGADKPMGSSPTQYFSLRWNNHPVNLVSVFTGLYQSETLVDVTLAAEGKHLQAHKMLLSACSDYFQSLFSVNPSQHPIVILKDVRFEDLQTVVQFMYNGIVNVSSEKLPDVLKTAETLQIKGLAEKFTETMTNNSSNRRMLATASFSSNRYLSVPSQYSSGSRQLSTESLPEDYLRRTLSSPRQASVESRQYSIESSLPSTTTNAAKRTVSPPLSPTRMQFRKKFRRMSGCSSERGNSVEDERSPGILTASRSSPPTIHLSPSRQSSSSTDGGHGTGAGGHASAASGNSLSVAKKKRELFSARSSRSGGSNKSSDASMDLSSKHQSSGSSGDRQGSISQSVEEPNIVINLQTPTTSYAMLRPPRTLGRTQSAGDATPTDLSRTGSMEEPKSPLSDAGKSKRSRFALSRQDCLEKGSLGEVEQSIPTIKSTPNSPLMLGVPSPNLGSPPASLHITPSTESFDNTGTHDSFLADHPPPVLPPPPLAHRLPSVRVISDAVDPLSLEETTSMHYGLLHPNFRSISLENRIEYVPPPPPPPPRPQRVNTPPNLPPSQPDYQAPSLYPLPPQPIPSLPPNASTSGSQHHSVTIFGSHSSMGTEQFGHCPKEREGPALGCNFCWNTTDVNGRILRRKTKYHCPECQANLCIVPCFQAYHEALEKDKANSSDSKT